MILRIYDASNYIYAGYYGYRRNVTINRGVREINGIWSENSFPANGVVFLLKNVFENEDGNTTHMIVFDRSPTIKRKMYADMTGDAYGYKGNRDSEPSKVAEIKFQKQLTEACCRKAGLCVQAVEGYEADDVIHTLVGMYKNDYEHIYIHTKDSDLAYLVDDNVSIAKVGEQGKIINKENYSFTVKTGHNIDYNTVHLNKLIKGDSADNIPGIGKIWAKYINKYVNLDNVGTFGDLNICRDILRKVVTDQSEIPNSHRVIPTFNLIVPLTVPLDCIDDFEHEPEWNMIEYYFLNKFNQEVDKWDCELLVNEFLELYNDLDIEL